MDEKKLIQQYPKIYHVAEAGSWPLIMEHGLLCTSALLVLLDCPSDQREQIEARHRPEKVIFNHPNLGSVVIRDQKPMSDKALIKVLTDGKPEDWYRILNSKVFFWPTLERLFSFLGARAYRNSQQIVIIVDTARLIADYRENIHLSPINSGATLFKPVARGSSTFLGIDAYPSKAVAEIAVVGGVMDVPRYAIEVRNWRGTAAGEIIWTPESPTE